MLATKSLSVTTDRRGACTLTLQRPERHNALDAALIGALVSQLQALERDPTVRVLILTGSGESFCSGGDLDWLTALARLEPESHGDESKNLALLLQTLHGLSKPSIALIQGPAYGGGVGLIACCDLAIASDSARFALTELRLGLLPAMIAPYILQAIGVRETLRLAISAEAIDAEEALRIGLLHQVVKPSELDRALDIQIGRVLKSAPDAIAEFKRMIANYSLLAHGDFDTAEGFLARLRGSPEAREGIAAFLEKRKPYWQE
ncbi:MAG: enoyl-CoA hydratase/isomerase family protein [Gammaproteobacteria bacterium]|nr:enoyl-CoA hydratase/isomerase family protein [Gammaproteobacteria bacterium]